MYVVSPKRQKPPCRYFCRKNNFTAITATPATTNEQVALISSLGAILLDNVVDCWKQTDNKSCYDRREEEEKCDSSRQDRAN